MRATGTIREKIISMEKHTFTRDPPRRIDDCQELLDFSNKNMREESISGNNAISSVELSALGSEIFPQR